jgi:hypothetical protein
LRCGRLFPDNRFEHISRFRDVRQINLGLYSLGFSAAGAGGLCGGMTLASPLEMGANLLRLVFFERAGVRLLFGNADFLQNIEDRLAFDFQFSGQIVDSNLTHPPLVSSTVSR